MSYTEKGPYDGGTVIRPYDKTTEESYKRYIKDKKREKKLFTKTKQMIEYLKKLKGERTYNEVMAGLRLPEKKEDIKDNFAIAVFSDNDESRLLAQVRRYSFFLEAKKRYPGIKLADIPIKIYGEEIRQQE